MQACGEGTIKVQLFHNGTWHDTILKDVWYVPDASAHPFSVKAAAKNGYCTIFSENKVVVHGTDGTVAASGKLMNDLYVLDVGVCIPRDAAQVHLATKTETLQVWHEHLGYQNKCHVVAVLTQHGMNVEASVEFCDGCALGKAHRRSFGTRTTLPNVIGEQINADVCGPMTEISAGGAGYYVCFKDDYSKYRRVFSIATRNEVVDCLQEVLKEVRTAGHVTKVLLSDGGKEFNCKALQKVLEEYGITHRIAMPYTPEQNGAAEQENRTTVESARSMLHASGLPKELWAEACNTAVYIFNHTGPTPVEGKTPLELWTGRSR
jgi:D-ribose pyranose/furanose isomerase RbsD